MPLSSPDDREPIHIRRIECRGYRRRDGMWDIEGHLVDTKSYSFDNDWRGRIEAGEAVHDMWIRLTIDDDFKVHAVEAVTDSSPFRVCPDVAGNFAALKGLSIVKGWRRAVAERLGGVRGCTHLVELLGPLGTTAFQTIFPLRKMNGEKPPSGRRPRAIDSCHALKSDGDVVKQRWPEFYTGS